LTRLLDESHVRYWFDADIKPGATWDEELEQRISEAAVVVVCLTDEYERSRYCTREIKFADTQQKRILPIAPEPRVWGKGFQFMFQELQIGSFDDGRGFRAFRDALQAAAPGVFAEAPLPVD
jgi:hypothetical protein